MKQLFWKVIGALSLGLAYVGLVTPGIPWSIFVVFSAYCFAKSSPAMHAWIYNHKVFGPFLTNWVNKKVFPTKFKYFMLLTMASTLVFVFFTAPIKAFCWSAWFMAMVAVWAWRYPGSEEEYDARIASNRKIGWLE